MGKSVGNIDHKTINKLYQGKGGAGHQGQTKGHKMTSKGAYGFAEGRHTGGHDSYQGELHEHFGKGTKDRGIGSTSGTHKAPDKREPPAQVGGGSRGSELIHNDGIQGHAGQPGGKGIGTGMHKSGCGGAEHHKGYTHGGSPHIFHFPPGKESHGFGHGSHQKSGPFRLSGSSKAHQIGKK